MPGAFPFVILFKGAKCAFDLPGFSEVQNAHLIFAPVQQEAFSAIVEFFRFWASFLIRGHTAHGTKMSYDIGSLSMDYSNPVSYTHLRAHETGSYFVCRLLLEKKKKKDTG